MNNIIKVLKGAFKYAKSTAKFIQDNPALDVSLPKQMNSMSVIISFCVMSGKSSNRLKAGHFLPDIKTICI